MIRPVRPLLSAALIALAQATGSARAEAAAHAALQDDFPLPRLAPDAVPEHGDVPRYFRFQVENALEYWRKAGKLNPHPGLRWNTIVTALAALATFDVEGRGCWCSQQSWSRRARGIHPRTLRAVLRWAIGSGLMICHSRVVSEDRTPRGFEEPATHEQSNVMLLLLAPLDVCRSLTDADLLRVVSLPARPTVQPLPTRPPTAQPTDEEGTATGAKAAPQSSGDGGQGTSAAQPKGDTGPDPSDGTGAASCTDRSSKTGAATETGTASSETATSAAHETALALVTPVLRRLEVLTGLALEPSAVLEQGAAARHEEHGDRALDVDDVVAAVTELCDVLDNERKLGDRTRYTHPKIASRLRTFWRGKIARLARRTHQGPAVGQARPAAHAADVAEHCAGRTCERPDGCRCICNPCRTARRERSQETEAARRTGLAAVLSAMPSPPAAPRPVLRETTAALRAIAMELCTVERGSARWKELVARREQLLAADAALADAGAADGSDAKASRAPP